MAGIDFLFLIIILLVSVVLHELAHGYAALALGDPTALYAGRLTLNPIKHIDPIGSIFVPLLGYVFGGFIIGWAKPVPFNPYNLKAGPWGEALVAAAGPASNIAIVLVLALIIRFVPGVEGSFAILLGYIVLINLVLAFFNLIPLPPLDGSKILFALLPLSVSYAYRSVLEAYGMLLILPVIFFWPLVFPYILHLYVFLTGMAL